MKKEVKVDEIKTISLESGALGFGISGSGPSVYAMCRGEENAEKVKSSIAQFMEKQSITYDLHLSKINPEGVKIL